jgi:propanediol dehydratase small subunit|tara:strand:- start:2642 stop:2833 length:192 start_codon:yes stop_codon:yes gene_type:complete
MAREGEKIDIGYSDTQILYEALSAYAKQQPDLSKAEHAITLADIFYDIILSERIEMEQNARLD